MPKGDVVEIYNSNPTGVSVSFEYSAFEKAGRKSGISSGATYLRVHENQEALTGGAVYRFTSAKLTEVQLDQ